MESPVLAGASGVVGRPALALVGATSRIVASLLVRLASMGAALLGSGRAAASASPLAQSLLRSTSDVARAGALLDQFLAQLPQAAPVSQSAEELKAQLLAFLDAQAGSTATAVEKRVDAVLWWYGTLWLPLVMVLCALYASRGGSQEGGEELPPPGRRASEGGSSARPRRSRSGRAAGEGM
jgi:hypothetical protein